MNWDLTYHFKNNEEFENALIEVNDLVPKFKEFEGKLHIEENFINYLIIFGLEVFHLLAIYVLRSDSYAFLFLHRLNHFCTLDHPPLPI